MQGDRGLAGARTAAHDEHPGEIGPDGFVLLGLDGGDDVAHAAGAGPVEGGEQRPLPHHGEAGVRGGLGVEHLVVETDQAPPVGLEVAAAGHVHGGHRGGAVEGLGDGSAPVDDQGVEIVVGDREAADVVRGGVARGGGGARVLRVRRVRLTGLGDHVEATEAQGLLADVEGGQTLPGVGLGGLPLEAGLVRATPLHVGVALGHPLRGSTHHVETGIGGIEMGLLGGELGVR